MKKEEKAQRLKRNRHFLAKQENGIKILNSSKAAEKNIWRMNGNENENEKKTRWDGTDSTNRRMACRFILFYFILVCFFLRKSGRIPKATRKKKHGLFSSFFSLLFFLLNS